jgi:hypothetical protein
MQPSEPALIAALTQNWEHARHVENLRERLNYLLWVGWGGVLAWSGIGDHDVVEVAMVFLFLTIATLIALFATLKWTIEFANHIAGAAACARLLRLNRRSAPRATRQEVRLPYPEFVGAMSLPLQMPLFLNVGPLVAMVQCVGVAAASVVLVRNAREALLAIKFNTVIADFDLLPSVIGANAFWIALGVFVACVGLAAWSKRQIDVLIPRRMPQQPPVVDRTVFEQQG